jgi:hypothetical protein
MMMRGSWLRGYRRQGVVKLSLIDWNLPTAADFDGWDFKGLACRSIVHIGPISLDVTISSNVRLLIKAVIAAI